MKLEQLIAHFDRIVDSPDTVPLLRRFIFDLAVQGKLVKQNPNDEPATNLLKRIEAAKEQSIRVGEIHKTKSLPHVDIEPYALPSRWEWTRLGNTGRIFNGNSINETQKNMLSRVTNGYPFIATKDVGYGRDSLVYENGIKVPFDVSGFKVAHAFAVLICAEGGSAGKKIGLTDRDICFGNKLYANEVWPGIHPHYILLVYQSSYFFSEFTAQMTGIIGGISLREFKMLPIPIPPEDEQQRIIIKVNELMALCDQLEAAQTERENLRKQFTEASLHCLNNVTDTVKLREHVYFHIQNFVHLTTKPEQITTLRQTVLNLAVRGRIVPQNSNDQSVSKLISSIQDEREELIQLHILKQHSKKSRYTDKNELPFDLVPTWQWVLLESLIVFGPQNGISPKPSSRTDAPKAITLTATTKGIFDARYFKHVEASIPLDSEFWLRSGDLLFQRGNTREYVGMAAYYTGEENIFLYPDLMMKVRLSEKVNLRYIHLCTIAPYARAYFSKHASGAQATMPKINQGILVQLPIPLPPAAEQIRIVDKVDELLTLCNQIEAELNTLQSERLQFMEAVFNQVLGGTQPAKRTTEAQFSRDVTPTGQSMLYAHKPQFTSVNPIKTIIQILECLDELGGVASPDHLLSAAGLGDDVEAFFDLLREGRDLGLLNVPTGANQMIRRNEHAD